MVSVIQGASGVGKRLTLVHLMSYSCLIAAFSANVAANVALIYVRTCVTYTTLITCDNLLALTSVLLALVFLGQIFFSWAEFIIWVNEVVKQEEFSTRRRRVA